MVFEWEHIIVGTVDLNLRLASDAHLRFGMPFHLFRRGTYVAKSSYVKCNLQISVGTEKGSGWSKAVSNREFCLLPKITL
jgi:hypothetical protein